MLKIFDYLKKLPLIGQNNDKNGKEKPLDHALKLAHEKWNQVKDEYFNIREKTKNLSKTNYDLALYHLNKGNVSEAVFRLKIVKKVWPENYEAYCTLAYCLALQEKFDHAREVIEELLIINPDYKERALDLLKSIDEQKHNHNQN